MNYVTLYFLTGLLLAIYARWDSGWQMAIGEYLLIIAFWPIGVLVVIGSYIQDFLNIEL